jgi:hypothetical protein
MSDRADVAIVGGGAAGLAAAIFAAQAAGPDYRVVILDGARTIGAKILVSGGGRCNVTHDIVTPEDFNGSHTIVRNVLAAFDAAATVRWFASLGVELKREETGKLFPVTDSARTILNVLLGRCRQLGVTILTASRVGALTAAKDSFELEHTGGTLACHRVILSTGGRSLPRSGSDGGGWDMVRKLGHTVTDTHPALVPLVLDPSMFHASVSGIAHEVELSTWGDGKQIDRRTGSLLWTHFGISGPVVMDASRHWVIARETGRNPQMKCNLLPPDGFEQADRWLVDQAASRPRASVGAALAQRIPERLSSAIVAYAKIDSATTLGQLSRECRRTLVHALTALPLPVAGPRGWNYAEVTAGGVPLSEIDFRTMQSRKVPGLYLAGEILDCDGRIGGFNFQWAWATGFLAGGAAARSVCST